MIGAKVKRYFILNPYRHHASAQRASSGREQTPEQGSMLGHERIKVTDVERGLQADAVHPRSATARTARRTEIQDQLTSATWAAAVDALSASVGIAASVGITAVGAAIILHTTDMTRAALEN
jgi:hypothetical protein